MSEDQVSRIVTDAPETSHVLFIGKDVTQGEFDDRKKHVAKRCREIRSQFELETAPLMRGLAIEAMQLASPKIGAELALAVENLISCLHVF